MKKRLIWVIAIAAVLICAGLMGIKNLPGSGQPNPEQDSSH